MAAAAAAATATAATAANRRVFLRQSDEQIAVPGCVQRTEAQGALLACSKTMDAERCVEWSADRLQHPVPGLVRELAKGPVAALEHAGLVGQLTIELGRVSYDVPRAAAAAAAAATLPGTIPGTTSPGR